MVWGILICCLLIPAVLLAAGEWMVRRPPQKINGLVGYRTRRSMASREAWLFAQEYCGRLWRKLGAWALPHFFPVRRTCADLGNAGAGSAAAGGGDRQHFPGGAGAEAQV